MLSSNRWKWKPPHNTPGSLIYIHVKLYPVLVMPRPTWHRLQFNVFSMLVQRNFIEIMWKQCLFDQCVPSGKLWNNCIACCCHYSMETTSIHPSPGFPSHPQRKSVTLSKVRCLAVKSRNTIQQWAMSFNQQGPAVSGTPPEWWYSTVNSGCVILLHDRGPP